MREVVEQLRVTLLATGVALMLAACLPSESGAPPRPFFLDVYCALRSIVTREDFAVRRDAVDPCVVEPPSLEDLLPEKEPESSSPD